MRTLASLIVLSASLSPLTGQWPSRPTAGVPRTPDGKPNLSAPSPRMDSSVEARATVPLLATTRLLSPLLRLRMIVTAEALQVKASLHERPGVSAVGPSLPADWPRVSGF